MQMCDFISGRQVFIGCIYIYILTLNAAARGQVGQVFACPLFILGLHSLCMYSHLYSTLFKTQQRK